MSKEKNCNCPDESMLNNQEHTSESQPMEMAMESSFQTDYTEPSETPPFQEEEDTDDGFGAGTWHNNKKLNALWMRNETRNSWVGVQGMGWKKLNSKNDSSCVALSILSAHARQYNRNVKFKVENNEIKEMYVW